MTPDHTQGLREAYARIIDPAAWSRAGALAQREELEPRFSSHTQASLALADALLALPSPRSREGDEADRVLMEGLPENVAIHPNTILALCDAEAEVWWSDCDVQVFVEAVRSDPTPERMEAFARQCFGEGVYRGAEQAAAAARRRRNALAERNLGGDDGWKVLSEIDTPEEVLMAAFRRGHLPVYAVASCDRSGMLWDWNYGFNPTHWRPLPLPPLGGGDEDQGASVDSRANPPGKPLSAGKEGA